jgi:hypothetical protein
MRIVMADIAGSCGFVELLGNLERNCPAVSSGTIESRPAGHAIRSRNLGQQSELPIPAAWLSQFRYALLVLATMIVGLAAIPDVANAATCATITMAATPLFVDLQSVAVGNYTGSGSPTYPCDPLGATLGSDAAGDESRNSNMALSTLTATAGTTGGGYTGGVFGTFYTDGGYIHYTPTSYPGYAYVTNVTVYYDNSGVGTFVPETIVVQFPASSPTVTGIGPSSGSTAGGTHVTITGTDLNGATAVTIGGTAATSVAVVSSTSITAVTPVGAAGTASVLVTTPGGTNAANSLFTYVAPPTITSLSSTSGPAAGGASVTINGSNLSGVTSVTIGGTAATLGANSATSIVVTTPSGTAGASDVVVTTAGGSATATGGYTYVAAPTIGGIVPSAGPTAGGTSVTITGSGFTGATAVTIGGAAATSVVVVSSTSITAVTPAGAAGTASVLVTTPGGTNAANNLFTYVTAPGISGITPSSGPTGGGTPVTINGSGFTGTTGVTIGGTAATSVVVVSSTSITAVTPAGTAGTASVLVTTPGGTNAANSLFTYVAPPTITSLSSTSGPAAGGASVTINGTNLSGVTSVTVGGTAATLGANSATSIAITTPSGTAGARDLVVTTAGGSATSSGGYTYIAAPTITSLSSTSGPTAGGTAATISGANLSNVTSVTVGGAAAALGANTATSIAITTPPGAAGARDVVVITAGGSATATGGFTYAAPPTIGSVTPSSGGAGGGTSVTISGSNLSGATSVTIGGAAATLGAISAGSIAITTPAGTLGPRDVVVTTPGGIATSTGGFTYVPGPSITSISPSSGPTGGGTSVTIGGANLSNVTSVTVGGASATLGANSATSIAITTPPGTAGAKDVVVTTAIGSTTSIGGYSYVSPPVITSLSPTSGPTAGGAPVTINGTNLSNVTSVTIGGTAATLGANSATSIAVTTPAGTAGAKDVVVTTVGGTATSTGGYTYVAAPTIGGIAPSSGPAAGGTSVTISGTNLSNVSSVTIGGTAATLGANSATSIVVTTPAGTAGARDVVVTTAGGNTTSTGGYTYIAGPTIGGIAPSAGPTAGGTSVTITGTNLSGVTSVTIGGAAASLGANSATSIVVTTPAGTAGARDVVVTTAGGSITSTGGYTYVAAPTIGGIAPSSGPAAGGTSVTITGTNLSGVTSVTIGGTAATLGANSATSIVVTAPAGTAGARDVVVTTAGGNATSTGGYSYIATLTLTSTPSASTQLGQTYSQTNVAGGGTAPYTYAVSGGTIPAGTTFNATTGLVSGTPTTAGGFSYTVKVTDSAAAPQTAVQAVSGSITSGITTTAVSSSLNPSQAGQLVTFTATVTGSGASPTGTVSFRDGSVNIGSAALTGGAATFSTSALTVGSHTVTASYGGNGSFSASTSPALLEVVNTPADSLKLRSMQVQVTRTVAQNSGQSISRAIDGAIADGFGDGGNFLVPGSGAMHFNFTSDPEDQTAASGESGPSDRSNGTIRPDGSNGPSLAGSAPGAAACSDGSPRSRASSRIDDAFAAIDRDGTANKAPVVAPKEWMLWADVSASGINRWGSPGSPTSTGATEATLYGSQVNALMGLTRKLDPGFLVGVLGGYETFDYRSDALAGRLKGEGWTVGSYLGWKLSPAIRFTAAAAYSGITYDGSAGTANGNFDGHRWLVSTSLIGAYQLQNLQIEPSATVYALWEHENAYTDSLGTLQGDRTFFTGRASGGSKLIYPIAWTSTITLAPYLGLYGDYYFNTDDTADAATAGAAPLASTPVLAGWSARATAGLGARFDGGGSLSFGTELGGLGATSRTWTFRGRGSIPF